MDVRILTAVFVLMFAAGQAWPVSTQPAVGELDTVNNLASDVATECRTARNVSGSCLPRQSCDYSTVAIDLSLYAPHGYIRPCTSAEVCCPPHAVVNTELEASASIEDEDE